MYEGDIGGGLVQPVIGITCSHDVNSDRAYLPCVYSRAIEKAGGIPLLLPMVHDFAAIVQSLQLVDGVLFSGGVDVDPVHQGSEPEPGLGEITPERDHFEMALAKAALEDNKGILAICRGMQLLNVVAGGTVYQDIYSEISGGLKHSQEAPRWYPTHKIKIEPGSFLAGMLRAREIRVNSFHHQAVHQVADGFRVTAVAEDGIIEAIESTKHSFVMGIQCHPEAMWERDPYFLRVFETFVEAVR